MTELENLKMAHQHLLALANGADFYTGQPLPNDTALNDVRNVRLFFYAATVLDAVVQNGGVVGGSNGVSAEKRGNVVVTDEFISRLTAYDEPLSVSEFAKQIGVVCAEFGMKNIPATAINAWLVEMRLLDEVTERDGKTRRAVNKDSGSVGIIEREYTNPQGFASKINLFTREAQEFLIEHLPDIVQHWRQGK